MSRETKGWTWDGTPHYHSKLVSEVCASNLYDSMHCRLRNFSIQGRMCLPGNTTISSLELKAEALT